MSFGISGSQGFEMTFRSIDLDLAGLQRVDVGTVDWIARLNFAARRTGIRLRLRNVDQALAGLICFCGLAEVLGLEP